MDFCGCLQECGDFQELDYNTNSIYFILFIELLTALPPLNSSLEWA